MGSGGHASNGKTTGLENHAHGGGGHRKDLLERENRGRLRLPRKVAGPLAEGFPCRLREDTGTGATETRCALEIERGAGPPNSGSQQAQLAFVREPLGVRGQDRQQLQGSRDPGRARGQHRRRRPDPGLPAEQGGHLGFFFKGRDVYIFDCITPAASLDQVGPASVRAAARGACASRVRGDKLPRGVAVVGVRQFTTSEGQLPRAVAARAVRQVVHPRGLRLRLRQHPLDQPVDVRQ